MRAPTCANHAPALSGHLVCVADAAGEAAAPTRPKKAASSTMGCFLGLKTAARPRLPASSTECNVAPSARHEARRSTPKTAFDAAPSRTRSRPRLTRPSLGGGAPLATRLRQPSRQRGPTADHLDCACLWAGRALVRRGVAGRHTSTCSNRKIKQLTDPTFVRPPARTRRRTAPLAPHPPRAAPATSARRQSQ